MRRVVVYKSESNLIQRVFYLKDSEELTQAISTELFDKKLSKFELQSELYNNGLDFFVAPSNPEFLSNLEDYIGSDIMEINVIPFSNLSQEVKCVRFTDSVLDNSNIINLLNLPEMAEIISKDKEFSELVNQINLTESDWNIALNFLTEKYKFKFLTINYVENNEEDSEIYPLGF